MLWNFVTSQDMYTLYPNLANQLPSTQSDFQPQIDAAYDRLLNDLYNGGYDVRYVSPYLKLTSSTLVTSIAASGSAVEAFGNHRRFVVELQQHSGTHTFTLYGSWSGSDWTAITTLDISASDSDGLFESAFTKQYKYYKYGVSVSGSVTADVFLAERAFDFAVMAGAGVLLFRSMLKEEGDVWDTRMKSAEKEYQIALGTVKFLLDSNKNQQADSSDEVIESTQTVFVR